MPRPTDHARNARILAAVQADKKALKEIAFDEHLSLAGVQRIVSAAGYRLMLVHAAERAELLVHRTLATHRVNPACVRL